MSDRPVVLAIDDEPGIRDVLTHLLKKEFSIHTAPSGPEGLTKADALIPDLIILDLMMPQMSGMAVLKKLREATNRIPVIILTAYGSVGSAVQAIKLGAADYIEKPFDNEKLKQTVRAFINLKKWKPAQELPSGKAIIGESPQIQKIWQLVGKYGPTDLPILLYGETGTGKELFARVIHEVSKRHYGPFVPLDVAAIPESLMESELFGYDKGAFTDAKIGKSGRLEWAKGGALFLDEIDCLSLSGQVKLLRVLQEDRYVPLGGRGEKIMDVRLISATNTDLGQAMRRGTFREDLYYRISGVTIELPPLRKREGDIERLTHHFVAKYSQKYDLPLPEISDEAIEWLLSYPWPGNVRELEHAIAGAVVIADRVILPGHLRPLRSTETHKHVVASHLAHHDSDDKGIILDLNVRYDLNKESDLKKFVEKVEIEAERAIIGEAQKRLHLKQTELAKFLGIDPKTLRTKMKRDDDPRCR